MAKEKKTKETVEEKVAAPVEAPAPPKPQTKSVKIPKLAKKNKSRLPRRQKKAQQKAAGARVGK